MFYRCRIHITKSFKYYVIIYSSVYKFVLNLNMNFLEMVYAYIDYLYAAGLLSMYRYCVEVKVH